jgi:hypothetical protein
MLSVGNWFSLAACCANITATPQLRSFGSGGMLKKAVCLKKGAKIYCIPFDAIARRHERVFEESEI